MTYATQPRTTVHSLQVATNLHHFIESQVLPDTGISAHDFWQGFDAIVQDLAPKNIALLAERDRLQTELDLWHKKNPGPIKDMKAYRKFLESIGYLVPVPEKVKATTQNVDAELALQAGPQLVVPILNARYALNAANARWGSLYDALYGTDAIPETGGAEKGKAYNPVRGAKVIEYARYVLDRTVPLKKGSHIDSTGYAIVNGELVVTLAKGVTSPLAKPAQFIGYQGSASHPTSVLLQHNGLHLDIQINRNTPIGSTDAAGVCDLVVEAALSTILDLEDSVAVVDAQDKVLAYSNWLGIVKGTLTEVVEKGGRTFTRGLNADRQYTGKKGEVVTLHGRSLLFLRNVGHLMTNPAILYTDKHGATHEIPEGILDAVVTTAIALHDLKGHGKNGIRNSRTGSVYIVKPKMHGPAEVAFAAELFSRVEKVLGLADSTVKLGIMDEERRTSVNLKACIAAASSRVAFINTGFLDRTGDEMHTAMQAGPMMRKGDMKSSAWIQAYEKNNVLVGLSCGLRGKAQIGKGMWAMPDLMAGAVRDCMTSSDKPVIAYVSPHAPIAGALMTRLGVPAFSQPESCSVALSSMLHASQLTAQVHKQEIVSSIPEGVDLAKLRGSLDEYEAKNLFSAFGIPGVREVKLSLRSPDLSALKPLGEKIVLKILSGAIAHKTEVGGVALNVPSAELLQRMQLMFKQVHSVSGCHIFSPNFFIFFINFSYLK